MARASPCYSRFMHIYTTLPHSWVFTLAHSRTLHDRERRLVRRLLWAGTGTHQPEANLGTHGKRLGSSPPHSHSLVQPYRPQVPQSTQK